MSTFSDATGAEEERGKGDTPKEETACKSNLGHTVKSRMTVIRFPDGALSEYNLCEIWSPALLCRRIYTHGQNICQITIEMEEQDGDF